MLEVIDAVHAYGDVVALDNVTVTAAPGEFLTILGESGSGKTTLLRLISGLEKPYKIGALRLNGVDVSEVPAFSRNCTTVFQNYALFPHMTVGANVEYGLRVRGVPPDERRQRAQDALKLVRLADKYDRRIHQLSGGERQRVALARALVPRPAILLLDEPLGALDEKLRVDMQVELMEIHKSLGMTFVYITHSQEEALTMSDRIILMRKGRIEQAGTPHEIFDRPVSRFVAGFMGVENLMEATLVGLDGDDALVEVDGQRMAGAWSGRTRPAVGDKVVVGMRAERLHIADRPPQGPGLNVLPGRLDSAIYKGKYLDRTVLTEVGPIKVRLWDSSSSTAEQGFVWWKKADCMVMSA
ncbi:ABC transporter ATP-binding protein [Geminicoccus flavidas]|uniref:ABC transporter ATP-binding protein n=1 Tax=Geminicoccus flavidas TaxID=2506407 RepID=UPI00190FB498|nr:ABC transporter ATP-binding protein [Geminicoccus flavidas]